jgi:precorrin-6B C5,15-methyltransferase / cobalt-precorrin-6B C5,C15-methyltransferase
MTEWRGPLVTVVGIGADGWRGLSESARAAITAADVLMGSARQLSLIPHTDGPGGTQSRLTWPSPLPPALRRLVDAHRGRAVCVLASGDPMFHGIGSTLVRLLGPDHVQVISHPSSVSVACARLGWPAEHVATIRAIGPGVDRLRRVLHPDRRILVLSADGTTPDTVAQTLVAQGYGASEMTVLQSLGSDRERILAVPAQDWRPCATDTLNIVAIHCRAGPGARPNSLVPGLPDNHYDHDGQLTKHEIRSITLAALIPMPGQLLWDIGAGAGSVAIEWLRSHESCHAIAVEKDQARAARIAENASRLGVPDIRIVVGAAPQALKGLYPPDAVFIGGGASVPGVIEGCWNALRPGGRLVVNAVTVESEEVVAAGFRRHGGGLTRLHVHRAAPIGGFIGWRPMMPVTQWRVTKEGTESR